MNDILDLKYIPNTQTKVCFWIYGIMSLGVILDVIFSNSTERTLFSVLVVPGQLLAIGLSIHCLYQIITEGIKHKKVFIPSTTAFYCVVGSTVLSDIWDSYYDVVPSFFRIVWYFLVGVIFFGVYIKLFSVEHNPEYDEIKQDILNGSLSEHRARMWWTDIYYQKLSEKKKELDILE